MSLTDDINTVRANVANNRKNLVGQIEALQVQMDNANSTIKEMDSLASVLDIVLADEQLLEKAGINLLAPVNAAANEVPPATPTPAA